MTDPGGGLDLSVFAGLGAQLGRVASMMEDRERRKRRLFEALHQVPVGPANIPVAAGAGVFQQIEMFGPKAGYMWSVRAMVLSGFTAGTVTVYKNATLVGGVLAGGEPWIPFASAGLATFGRGERVLDQNDSLLFVATGITLAANQAGIRIDATADNFVRELLPDYLGIGDR
jgi:hypothetical protein